MKFFFSLTTVDQVHLQSSGILAVIYTSVCSLFARPSVSSRNRWQFAGQNQGKPVLSDSFSLLDLSLVFSVNIMFAFVRSFFFLLAVSRLLLLLASHDKLILISIMYDSIRPNEQTNERSKGKWTASVRGRESLASQHYHPRRLLWLVLSMPPPPSLFLLFFSPSMKKKQKKKKRKIATPLRSCGRLIIKNRRAYVLVKAISLSLLLLFFCFLQHQSSFCDRSHRQSVCLVDSLPTTTDKGRSSLFEQLLFLFFSSSHTDGKSIYLIYVVYNGANAPECVRMNCLEFVDGIEIQRIYIFIEERKEERQAEG